MRETMRALSCAPVCTDDEKCKKSSSIANSRQDLGFGGLILSYNPHLYQAGDKTTITWTRDMEVQTCELICQSAKNG